MICCCVRVRPRTKVIRRRDFGLQLPRLGNRVYLFTFIYVVSVRRGFLFLWVLGMGYVFLLWHSLNLHYNYFGFKSYPKDWRSPGSNPRALVYKACGITTTPRKLLCSYDVTAVHNCVVIFYHSEFEILTYL